MAVSDLGSVWRAHLVLDPSGRLTGIDSSSIEVLTDTDGRPLVEKMESDAEGLAVLGDGTFLVSFEDRHRIWRYQRDVSRPTPVPWPRIEMADNGGMEALATDPAAGNDAYLVGIETSGQVWSCRLSADCRALTPIEKPDDFGLVALRRLPGDRTVAMLRAYDERRGNRITVEIFRGSRLVDRLDMARPMTIDNFEGVAAVERPRGALRLYLLSDDNGSRSQRTILMAFDWQPPA